MTTVVSLLLFSFCLTACGTGNYSWVQSSSKAQTDQLNPNNANTNIPTEVNKVALLTPLSGPLAEPGKAIRDGFMAAAANTGKNPENIRVYDTNNADIKTLYRDAIQQDADVVVGPLDKNKVQTLADDAELITTPVLALNYTSTSTLPNRFYEFGLSPQDEAAQVALKASQQGYKSAIIISPSGAWGAGIAETFAKQWKEQNGQIVDRLTYAPKENFTKPIKQLLRAQGGNTRGKKTRGTHRQDVDVIFLVATPTVARQIVPLFKFYYAGDIPIYATSLSYAGTTQPALDRDLDGLIFCDMPWVFAEGNDLEKNHEQTGGQWSTAFNRYTRLYALGFDAFNLSQQLGNLENSSGISSRTGRLHMNDNHRISRQLEWARFQDGIPQVIS